MTTTTSERPACATCAATDDFWAWYDVPERQSIEVELDAEGKLTYDYTGATESADAGSDYSYVCRNCGTEADTLEELCGLPVPVSEDIFDGTATGGRGGMGTTVALILVALALALAGCGGNDSGAASSDDPASEEVLPEEESYEPTYADEMERFASIYNQEPAAMFNIFSGGYADTTTRCVMGYSAAFPDQALLSVIESNGLWGQINISESGADEYSFKSGTDYNTALDDVEDFFSDGVGCTLHEDGTVTVP